MEHVAEFKQTGGLFLDGQLIDPTAYSGHGEGLNNPAMENVRGVGVLPRGEYEIVEWVLHHPKLGSYVARLRQISGETFGRSALDVHGDNHWMNHTASDGCIVAQHAARVKLHDSGAKRLIVT